VGVCAYDQSSQSRRGSFPELGDAFFRENSVGTVERVLVLRARAQRLHAGFDDAGENKRVGVGNAFYFLFLFCFLPQISGRFDGCAKLGRKHPTSTHSKGMVVSFDRVR
jgi:hypothetical protein